MARPPTTRGAALHGAAAAVYMLLALALALALAPTLADSANVGAVAGPDPAGPDPRSPDGDGKPAGADERRPAARGDRGDAGATAGHPGAGGDGHDGHDDGRDPGSPPEAPRTVRAHAANVLTRRRRYNDDYRENREGITGGYQDKWTKTTSKYGSCLEGCDQRTAGGTMACNNQHCAESCDNECRCKRGWALTTPGSSSYTNTGYAGLNFKCVKCEADPHGIEGQYMKKTWSVSTKDDDGDQCRDFAPATCAPGKYVTITSSSTVRQRGENEYSSTGGSTSCKGVCPSGKYTLGVEPRRCTPQTSNCECESYYSWTQKIYTFSQSFSSRGFCNECQDKTDTECGRGKFLDVAHDDNTQDSKCDNCGGGKYQDQTATTSTVCKEKRDSCGEGQFLKKSSNAEQDNTCVACPDGEYQDQADHSFNTCKPRRETCGAGQRLDPGADAFPQTPKYPLGQTSGATTNAQCKACAPSAGQLGYAYRTDGANRCPAGSGRLGSVAACRAAAQATGLTYRGETRFSSARNHPADCYRDAGGQVWFSSHAGKAKPNYWRLCKTPWSYAYGTYDANACPAGSEPLGSAAACEAVAQDTDGLTWVAANLYVNHPRDCFWRGGKVWFNTHTTGNARPGYKRLCKSNAPAATPTITAADLFKAGNSAATECTTRTVACPSGKRLATSATPELLDNTCEPCGTNEYKAGTDGSTSCRAKRTKCVGYKRAAVGTCAPELGDFIESTADCEAAAASLGLSDTTASAASNTEAWRARPYGCFYQSSTSSLSEGHHHLGLWWNPWGSKDSGDTTCVSLCAEVDPDMQLIAEDPAENTASRTVDDTLCRSKAQCKAGQLRSLLAGQAVPDLGAYTRAGDRFDECRPCPLHTYRDADALKWSGSHVFEDCLPCPVGTFTLSGGGTSKALCQKPNVVTLRSTHRIYYYFNAALKASTRCIRTSISMRDTSNAKGISAVRSQALSPVCTGGEAAAGSYTKKYLDDQQDDDLSWNGYPLSLNGGGELLVVDVLPGQTVDSLFAQLDSDGKELMHTVTVDGVATQVPLVALAETNEAICGCVDYTNMLPPSACEDAVMVTTSHQDVAGQGTERWELKATDASLALLPTDTPRGDLHVSAVPFKSYACYDNQSALGTLQQHNPAPVRVGAGTAEACAGLCNAATEPSAGGCHAYNFFDDGSRSSEECRLLGDAAAAPLLRDSEVECAAACAGEAECRAFAYAAAAATNSKQCALFFPSNYGATLHLSTTEPTFEPFAAPRYCVGVARESGRDNRVRYTIGADWGTVAIRSPVPQATTTVGSTVHTEAESVALLRACPKLLLGCSGAAACTATHVMGALHDAIATVKGTELLKSAGAAEDPAYLNFGCKVSGSGERAAFEDCMPPDAGMLADIRHGYFFYTDASGRPGHVAAQQVRGHVTFAWTDYSSCEQAFAVVRRQETATNEGVTRAWGAPESFAQDYYIHGEATCQESVRPEDLADHLYSGESNEDKREVGLWQEYCISAMAENGAAAITYESSPMCAEHQVFWESTIAGQVRSRVYYVPTAGVKVDWHVPGTGINGTTRSDGAGNFQIHVRDTAMEMWRQFLDGERAQLDTAGVVIALSEVDAAGDTRNTQFICEDQVGICGGYDPITSEVFPPATYTVPATYLKFEHGDLDTEMFYTTPIVPFDGQVYFPLLSHTFAAADSTTTLSSLLPEAGMGSANRCFLRVAQVCVMDHERHEAPIKCLFTGPDGRFHVAVPLHNKVTVQISYHSHIFEFDGEHVDPALVFTLPSRSPLPALAGKLVTVYSITDETAFLRVNHRDVTGETIHLGAHGTRCRLPVGTTATFAVKAPVSEYACTPSNQIFVDVPTELQTWARVMLPGHKLDVTLVALEPAWPQVTDASSVGYFHRLRTRARRQDLLKASEERLGLASLPGAASPAEGGATEPIIVEYEYHPPARIDIVIEDNNNAALEESLLPALQCAMVTAVDGELARQADYQPVLLALDGDLPQWAFPKATRVRATAIVTELLPYPNRTTPEVCDWVEYPGTNANPTKPPVEVRHWNRLGLSLADLDKLELDPTTAEYKEFRKVLSKTMGDLDDAGEARLSTCVVNGQEGCTLPVTRITGSTETDLLDDTCTTAPDGTAPVGYTPVQAAAEGNACAAGWEKLMNVENSKYRQWHKLDFYTQLTDTERGLWETLGLAAAYRSASTQASADWGGFVQWVLVKHAKPWDELNSAQVDAAALLHFTDETWGRQWAFVERILHVDTALLLDWADVALIPHERQALEVLGWSAGTWESAGATLPALTVDFDALNMTYQDALAALRVTPRQWDAALHSKDMVSGCFWHYGTFGVETHKYVEGADGTSSAAGERRRRRRRRRQRRSNERTRRAAVCPAGLQSDASQDHQACVACGAGTYKDTTMGHYPMCISKRTSCPHQDHRLYSHAALFGTESAVTDDTICVPQNPSPACPAGTRMAPDANCTVCPGGTYSSSTSTATECTPKALTECPAGYYFIAGLGKSHDDNMCVVCAHGTYQPGVTNSTTPRGCLPKLPPASCPAGEFLSEGSSTQANDLVCAACPTGTFSGGAQLARACTGKRVSTCAPGTYFYTRYSPTEDDNVCLPCPHGTYKDATSARTTCAPKFPAHCGAAGGRYLHAGASRTENDHACIRPGFCAPGFRLGNASEACEMCPDGTFLAESSNATACLAKVTHGCPPGQRPDFSASPARNETACADCPAGSYSESWSDGVCTAKEPLVAVCTRGSHVSTYMSTTSDDAACAPCGAGTYMASNTTATACQPKILPLFCPAGQHVSMGDSTVADDWVCAACPSETYTSEDNTLLACTAKLAAAACVAPEVRLLRNGSDQDHVCAVPANCNPGHQVAPDGIECDPCPFGTYNSQFTTSPAACTPKSRPDECAPGQRLLAGASTSLDDWRCGACPLGQYSGGTRGIAWGTGKWPTAVDVPATVCTPKAVVGCPSADTYFYRGNSAVENDWACVAKPTLVPLCSKERQYFTNSLLGNLQTGMPELVAPFTKSFTASIKAPGYPRHTSRAVVVVTGSRFVSDGERLAFPQSRPILVLHDPPGGSSFSAFKNQKVETKIKHYRETVKLSMKEENDFTMTYAAKVKQKDPLPMAATPVVIVNSANAVENAAEAKAPKKLHYNPSSTLIQVDKHDTKLQDSLKLEFSYTTSASPLKSGPASDAFLVPAVWFEVVKVWNVVFAAATCTITGSMDVSLVANADLKGFAFVTTNDIETRTLPLTSDLAADITFRFHTCDTLADCCRDDEARGIDDADAGCTATTLAEYCAWKHAGSDSRIVECETRSSTDDETVEAEANWLDILDRNYKHHEKARNMKAGLGDEVVQYEGSTNTYGVEVRPLAGLVPTVLTNNARGFGGTELVEHEVPNVIGRHHGDAADAIGGVGGAAGIAAGAALVSSTSPALATAALLAVGTILVVDAATDPVTTDIVGTRVVGKSERDALVGADVADDMQTWNMLEFSGGGSRLDVSTNQFDAYNMPDGLFADTGSTQTREENCPMDAEAITLLSLKVVGAIYGVVGTPAEMLGPATSGVTKGQVAFFLANIVPPLISLAQNLETVVSSAAGIGDPIDGKCGRKTEVIEGGFSNNFDYTVDVFGNKFTFKGTNKLLLNYLLDYQTTMTDSKNEASRATFHLEDPDFGDYFVVSTWSDPDYGTPLFSLDGGASQCQWEVGTVHRSAPTITAEYVGADAIGPQEPALFKVKVGNELDYYGAAPRSGVFRPGWSALSGGYVLPEFVLSVDPLSLRDGMTVVGASGAFPGFGKGTFDQLVRVFRGPTAHEYLSNPQLTWAHSCSEGRTSAEGTDNGERASAALHMPNPEKAIRYTPPCPSIAWSGAVLENEFFASLAGQPAVDTAVFVPAATGRAITRLALEWRMVLPAGFKSAWHGFSNNDQVDMASSDRQLYTAAWDTANMEDGIYEVRATAECTELAPAHDYDASHTPTVRGVLDRAGPELLQLTSSSASASLGAGDYLVLTFSEEIRCNGHLVNGLVKADLQLTVVVGSTTYVSGPQNNHLDYSCEGVEMRVSLPNYDAAAAEAAAGQEVSVTIGGRGVYDLAGNEAQAVVGRVLSAGQASVERVAISAAVDARAAEVSAAVDARAAEVSSQVGAVGAVGNVTQDLVVALDAKVASKDMVESLRANVSSQIGHVDTKIGHVDTKIASLEAMLAQVLSVLGSEPAAAVTRCGGDAAPAMNSFSRYIRGYLTGKKLAATPTLEGCAEECLASAAGCAGFAFESSTSPCVIATGTATFAEAYSADVGGRWRAFAVKTACGN